MAELALLTAAFVTATVGVIGFYLLFGHVPQVVRDWPPGLIDYAWGAGLLIGSTSLVVTALRILL